MNTILAYPPTEASQDWVAWLMQGRLLNGQTVAPDKARRLVGSPGDWPVGHPLVLVIPASKISWHAVTLPTLPRYRWSQALVGLLEDQVLGEPEQLHFALAPRTEAGAATLVAVCDKAWLTQTLQALLTHGHAIQRIAPEFEPGAKALHLIGQPERAQLIGLDEEGVCVMPLTPALRESLQSWVSTLPDADSSPLWAEPALASLAQEALQRPAQLMNTAQRLWQAAQSDWNLAQFDMAAAVGGQRRQKLLRAWAQAWQSTRWRPLRWGLLALALAQVLGLLTWAWQASSRQKSLQDEIQGILKTNFPQVKLIVEPVQQMRREVQALALSSGSAAMGDLGVMLSALAQAGAPPIKRLDYSAGQLQLSQWPLPAPQAQALQAALASRGYLLQGQDQQWQMKVRSP